MCRGAVASWLVSSSSSFLWCNFAVDTQIITGIRFTHSSVISKVPIETILMSEAQAQGVIDCLNCYLFNGPLRWRWWPVRGSTDRLGSVLLNTSCYTFNNNDGWGSLWSYLLGGSFQHWLHLPQVSSAEKWFLEIQSHWDPWPRHWVQWCSCFGIHGCTVYWRGTMRASFIAWKVCVSIIIPAK